jgi:hypothetical protein
MKISTLMSGKPLLCVRFFTETDCIVPYRILGCATPYHGLKERFLDVAYFLAFGSICRLSLVMSYTWFSNVPSEFIISKTLFRNGNEIALREALRGVHMGCARLPSWILEQNHTDFDYDAIVSILQSLSVPIYDWLEYLKYREADSCVNANTLHRIATEILSKPYTK